MKLLFTLIAALFFTNMPAWAEECSRYYCFSVHWVTVEPADVDDINVHARDKEGATPLHWAALFSEAKIVEMLLKAGADVNVKDEDGETPLQEAAALNSPKVADDLLKGGADVNAQNDYGSTPLHGAINRENPDIFVEVLLKAGANAKIKNSDEKTAFALAKDNPSLRDTKAYDILRDAQY